MVDLVSFKANRYGWVQDIDGPGMAENNRQVLFHCWCLRASIMCMRVATAVDVIAALMCKIVLVAYLLDQYVSSTPESKYLAVYKAITAIHIVMIILVRIVAIG